MKRKIKTEHIEVNTVWNLFRIINIYRPPSQKLQALILELKVSKIDATISIWINRWRRNFSSTNERRFM